MIVMSLGLCARYVTEFHGFISKPSSDCGLDLPYIYSTEGKIKEPNLAAEAGQGLLSAVGAYARGDMVSGAITPANEGAVLIRPLSFHPERSSWVGQWTAQGCQRLEQEGREQGQAHEDESRRRGKLHAECWFYSQLDQVSADLKAI